MPLNQQESPKQHNNSNHRFLNTWNIPRKKKEEEGATADCAGKHKRVLCMENAAGVARGGHRGAYMRRKG